jgi:hypothetical protein
VRRALAAAVLAGASLIFPASASAAKLVIEAPGDGLTLDTQVDRQGHNLTVTYAGGTYTIVDQAGVKLFGGAPGCTTPDKFTARCSDAAFSLPDALIDVFGSRGQDNIDIRSVGPDDFARVNGGLGDDHLFGSDVKDQLIGKQGSDTLRGRGGPDGLYGGGGFDILKGGTGADSLFGGKLGDLLLARDGQRDRRIVCGAGQAEHAMVDPVDPHPVSC